MKNAKRLLSLALALCLVITVTGVALPSSLVEAEKSGAAASTSAEDKTSAGANPAIAQTLEESVKYSAAGAAKQSEGTKTVADDLARRYSGRTRLKNTIENIITPLKVITPVNSQEDLVFVLKKLLVESVGGLADSLIRVILKAFPQREYPFYDEYESQNLLKGTADYKTAPAAGARWSVGYKSVSIVPDDILTSPYFTAGYFNNYLGKNPITAVLDDQCFRAAAFSDGSGRGIAVFVSLDGFSISNTDVRKFRAYMADFIREKNIVSLNITASHSHYCIDTSGLGVSLLPFMGENLLAGLTGNMDELQSTNKKFMDGLFTRGAQAVKDAVNGMETGSLYFRTADIEHLISDKHTPIVFDPNANVIRFVPDSENSAEIWLVNAGIHPTGYPRESTEMSSEFPYAIVKYAKELAGADVAFYQGAQNEISKYDDLPEVPEGASDFDRIQIYGRKIVECIIASSNDVEVEPLLNVTHAETFFPIQNPILMAAAKLNLLNNTCVHTTGRLEDALLVTELGYAEFGTKFAIAMVPGEMCPEIAWGGAKTAAESWNGTDWLYPSMQELAGRKLIVFGLTNDQIGYIIPDNEVATPLADALGGMFGKHPYGEKNSHYPEMLTTSRKAASYLMQYFTAMLADFKND
ncbi:MAG: hypothetical protein ACOYJX_06225 [Acutalibacteraceae bacterium]|jgi:hypothetical protein